MQSDGRLAMRNSVGRFVCLLPSDPDKLCKMTSRPSTGAKGSTLNLVSSSVGRDCLNSLSTILGMVEPKSKDVKLEPCDYEPHVDPNRNHALAPSKEVQGL